MKDELVTFETGKLAKEKGFDEFTKSYFNAKGELFNFYAKLANHTIGVHNLQCTAPTQSLLQRWLREKHGHHIMVIPTVTANWTYHTVRVIADIDNDVIVGLKSVSELPPFKGVCGEDFSTFELALEAALKETLKNI